MPALGPAVSEGRTTLLREHMVVGKAVVAGAPVPVVDRNTIVEIVDLDKEERGRCHGGGDNPYRQVVNGHSADLNMASHAVCEEAAWVGHAALGADGDSSCPGHGMAPVGLNSWEVKRYCESSHMTQDSDERFRRDR